MSPQRRSPARMTPYREAAARPLRPCPERVAVRGASFWVRLGVAAFFVAAAAALAGIGWGATMRCERAGAGAVGSCHVREPVTWTSLDFPATRGALTVMTTESDDVEQTHVSVGAYRTFGVDPDRARAVVAGYDAFVEDASAAAFGAWMPGPWMGAAFGAFLLASGATRWLLVAWYELAIDVAGDRWILAARRPFRRRTRAEHALSTIRAFEIVPVDDSDAYDLVVVFRSERAGETKTETETTRIAVLRESQGTCERVRAALERAAALDSRT